MMKAVITASALLLLVACTADPRNDPQGVPPYIPQSDELHDDIVRQDSLLFTAYNQCDLEAFASLVSEDLEFYHDVGGLETSKANLVSAIKNNICGKVRRELLPGSIEVYPVPGYGAVEMGAHRFYNLVEGGEPSRFSKFVQLWHREDSQWKLARVISLH